MHLELVTIGTELLLGQLVDTNGPALGRALAAIGVRVVRRTAVDDEPGAIADAVGDALRRTGAVLTTGGLGPTSDDVTKHAVAGLFGAALRFDDGVWAAIEERFRRLGRTPSPANRSQAEVPDGATVLPNRWGTAPGLWLEGGPGLVIMLPGVPGEMQRLLEHEVLPRLGARAGAGVVRSAVVRTTSIAESSVAARVGPLEPGLAPLTLAYLPTIRGVDLRLTAWQLEAAEADRRLEAGCRRLEEALPENAYGRDEDDLAAVLLATLRGRGDTLAVAESCTGGLLGARITAVPGSSEVFTGGLVCYADRLKLDLADLDPALLAAHGAVSEPVASALALGAARRLGATAAIGVTGIAGPGGGSEAKPVGTVCFGWVLGETRETGTYVFPGDRVEIRERAAQFALHRLVRLARGGPGAGAGR